MEENILAKISGDCVSAALKTLPDAETAKEKIQEAIIDVPGFGQVRFTCKRFVGRHNKHRLVF